MFNLIKQNKNIHGLTFFDHTFLYTAYADDTTFFLKDKESVKVVMNVFDTFPIYSGSKPNKSKWHPEMGVNGTLWNGMYKCNKKSVKILCINFSYNKKIENEENFIKLIKKIKKVFSIGITLVDVHLNWLNWFLFLILEGDLLGILIDCMIFLSPFLDVTRMSMSTVSFLVQLDSGILCL